MTSTTPFTSKPRAATSVATRMVILPFRKLSRASSRWRWSLSPWMAAMRKFARCSDRSCWSHMRFVPQKTKVRFFWFLSTSYSLRVLMSIWSLLSRGPTTFTIWVMSVLALSSSRSPIWTLNGLYRKSSASFLTSFGQVAVKKRVCLFCGTSFKILRIWGSNPMSSMRSASSSTNFATLSSRTCRPSRKSFSLPGVAMRQCTPARMALSCWCLGAPPYAHTQLIWLDCPKRCASFSICTASSRVGASVRSTGSRAGIRLSRMCLNAGKRNASVFPLPVAATPMTSLPWNARGHEYA
mmetsp:Transcript_41101/g.106988  ORF Transcript_41101/g.106988 Transcript_41101/m.106988 type:complete len:296 (+) Transcript_41101:566-1453(+)